MDLIDFLKEYWTLIVAVASVIYSYATLKSELKDHDKRISLTEGKLEEMNPIWVDIKERLASIEATLKILIK